MIQILQLIALLCQVHPAVNNMASPVNMAEVETYQLNCRSKYMACLEKKRKPLYLSDMDLWECVKEKKI